MNHFCFRALVLIILQHTWAYVGDRVSKMEMHNMCLAFENRCLGYSATKPKLPLLLVTGFLGSGKTTLLRHLLCNKSNLRLAVLGVMSFLSFHLPGRFPLFPVCLRMCTILTFF